MLKFALHSSERWAFNVVNSVPAISPNGRHVAIVANTTGKRAIWLRDLDSLTGQLADPEPREASNPFWSPDSRALGFFAGDKLKKIEIAGGLAVTLCDAYAAAGGSWSGAGVIVFARRYNNAIMRVPDEAATHSP